MHANNKGFSLLELMLVVGIIAILAAIAVPNYQSYLNRSACEEAKSELTGAANMMERFRAQNNRYPAVPIPAVPPAPPPPEDLALEDAQQANIAITASDAGSFTLTATGIGRLQGLVLTLSSTGVRTDNNAALDIWNSCSGI